MLSGGLVEEQVTLEEQQELVLVLQQDLMEQVE
jgi:hypothetical protein